MALAVPSDMPNPSAPWLASGEPDPFYRGTADDPIAARRVADRAARGDLEIVRSVRLGRFTVRLYDLGVYDRRGCTALGYRVICRGETVCADLTPAGAVYGSPMHADDSDATMAASISLICHCAMHDSDDRRVDCSWDAEELSDLASMRWPDL